jgi:xanthine dehydrogenase accessory factor
LGTRKKIPERLDALRELGVTEEQLGRLCAPIGMNIGAILPGEIALSILTDMVSAQHGIYRAQEVQTGLPFPELA